MTRRNSDRPHADFLMMDYICKCVCGGVGAKKENFNLCFRRERNLVAVSNTCPALFDSSLKQIIRERKRPISLPIFIFLKVSLVKVTLQNITTHLRDFPRHCRCLWVWPVQRFICFFCFFKLFDVTEWELNPVKN